MLSIYLPTRFCITTMQGALKKVSITYTSSWPLDAFARYSTCPARDLKNMIAALRSMKHSGILACFCLCRQLGYSIFHFKFRCNYYAMSIIPTV